MSKILIDAMTLAHSYSYFKDPKALLDNYNDWVVQSTPSSRHWGEIGSLESITNLIESLILYDQIFIDSIALDTVRESKVVFDLFSQEISTFAKKKCPTLIIDSSIKLLSEMFKAEIGPALSFYLAEDESVLINQLFNDSKAKEFFSFRKMYFDSNIFYNYHILRTIQYISYAAYLECSYLPNPARANIIESFSNYNGRNIRKDIVTFFDNETRKQYSIKVERIFPSSKFNLDIPLLVTPIIEKIRTGSDLVTAIIDVRESEYAKEFRKWCDELEMSLTNNAGVEINDKIDQLQEVATEWKTNLKLNRYAFKKIQIKDPFGVFSTDINFPYWNIRKIKKYRPFLFLHSLIKNWDVR